MKIPLGVLTFLLVGILLVSCNNAKDAQETPVASTSTTTTQAPPKEPEADRCKTHEITITIATNLSSQVSGQTSVKRCDTVKFIVSWENDGTDKKEELHLHGEDKTLDIINDGMVKEWSVLIKTPGQWELELESSHKEILTLKVNA